MFGVFRVLRLRSGADRGATLTLSATLRATLARLFRVLVLVAVISWAAMAFGHGDPSDRLAFLDTTIEAEPNSVSLLLERSELHRRHGRFEMAISDLSRAQSLSPHEHHVNYLLGRNHLEKGDFANAETALRRYLAVVPGSSSGHVALARALSAQNRHLAAARHYSLAIAAQPIPVPDHYLGRARAYRAAGGRYLDNAITGLDEAMDAVGPLIALQKLAVEIELALGNADGRHCPRRRDPCRPATPRDLARKKRRNPCRHGPARRGTCGLSFGPPRPEVTSGKDPVYSRNGSPRPHPFPLSRGKPRS